MASLLNELLSNNKDVESPITKENLDLAWQEIETPLENVQAYSLAKLAFNFFIEQEDYKLAEIWLKRMIEHNNETNLNNLDCRYHLGKFYYETDQKNLALNHWSQVYASDNKTYFNNDSAYHQFIKENYQEQEELSENDYKRIRRFIDKGIKYIEWNKLLKAQQEFKRGLEVLPEPKTDWEIATNLYVGIGDSLYFMKQFADANIAYKNALLSLGDKANPYLYLRLGQTFFEMDDLTNAKLYLEKVNTIDNNLLLQEDSKFIKFLENNNNS